MRAVITVIGKDNVGILHKVSGVCAEYQANVLEVTQSVLQDVCNDHDGRHHKDDSRLCKAERSVDCIGRRTWSFCSLHARRHF